MLSLDLSSPCKQILAVGPTVFLQITFACFLFDHFLIQLPIFDSKMFEFDEAIIKYIILSIHIASPRIKQIRTHIMKPVPPSLNNLTIALSSFGSIQELPSPFTTPHESVHDELSPFTTPQSSKHFGLKAHMNSSGFLPCSRCSCKLPLPFFLLHRIFHLYQNQNYNTHHSLTILVRDKTTTIFICCARIVITR